MRGALLLAVVAVSCASAPPDAPRPPVAIVSVAPVEAGALVDASAPPPKPALDLQSERLRSISVSARLPDLAKKQADAGGTRQLAVLFENASSAIERTTADMFVRYVANGAETVPYMSIELSGEGMMGVFQEDGIPSSVPELARYGGETRVCYAEEAPHFLCRIVEQPPLPDRTPGLVWQVDDGGVATFLSLDGETYAVDLAREEHTPAIEPGAGPPERWPAPVSNPGFSGYAATALRRRIPGALHPLAAAFTACAARTAPRARRAIAAKGSRDREIRAWLEEELSAYEIEMRLVRRSCRKEIAAWEKAFASVLATSVAERTALFEKARARAVSLGAPR